MKYILIILISLFSLSASAQDTIKIPTSIAKQIAKDLVSGDSAKAELKLTNENITLLEKKVVLKDSIISGHVQKGIMYEERIKNEQLKFDTQQKWVKDLQKQNKKTKAKLTFNRITFIGIITGLTYLYITK
jgi:hypothetical protein